jgi:P pilus assembly chaperone PapD
LISSNVVSIQLRTQTELKLLVRPNQLSSIVS